ncbi:MAG TPA: FtsX-like permease family protein [Bryobacteraceae bacterium]|nr:FtsX-like permease family protein [Bryobacteraceae bacterium]
MILLKLISWPYVRQHLPRWLLTIAGIVLGVAVFVGIHTANQSVVYAFHQTVDRIAGSTQLQISAGETGFDENVLDRVQAMPQVRVAVPVIEAVVSTGVQGQGNLLILGVDMTGDRSLRDYDLESSGQGTDDDIDDPLVFLAQPDSLMVSDTYARENHLGLGAKVPMSTMDGRKLFTIRGIMKAGGLTSAFGGNLAVMDVYAAQKVFGRGRKFDRIDLAIKDGSNLGDVQAKLEALLGTGFQVQEPSARAQQFDSISRVYTLTANVTSVFALFIGMFIIYNTFQIAVTQRRTEIGILRALGATRRQIRTLFLGESVVAGLFGSVLGLLVGILIARGMTGYIGSLLGEIYGIAQKADEISTNPTLMTFAVVLGVITSVVAAVVPARSAARVDPVQALQKGRYQQLSAGENRFRRIAALLVALAAAACLLFERYRIFFYAGDALAVLAALLLTPTFAVLLARALRPLLRWLRPVEGTLAADSLLQAPRRTSGAVAALMLSLALVVALGGLTRASYDSIFGWLTVALNPDLFVSPSQSLTQRDFRFPESMGAQLRAIPGIGDVQLVRDARIDIQGKPTMFVAADINDLRKHATLPPVAGNTEEMFRLAALGKAVLASENFALLRGFKLGDVVDIPSPSGALHLPIAGIVTDYSDEQGSLLVDRSLYKRYWSDSTVNIFRIYLAPGASEADVKRRILEQFGNQRRLFVLTNREVRRYILRLTDQWFGITYVQIAVAVFVAILGIVNTLTVSITDRRRELGVLQAVGGLRNQIRGTIWLEALAVGTIGLILGLALGALQLYYSLHISAEDMAGLRLSYEYPYTIALLLLPGILLVAFLSAIAPAETAVRGSLVEALEYE